MYPCPRKLISLQLREITQGGGCHHANGSSRKLNSLSCSVIGSRSIVNQPAQSTKFLTPSCRRQNLTCDDEFFLTRRRSRVPSLSYAPIALFCRSRACERHHNKSHCDFLTIRPNHSKIVSGHGPAVIYLRLTPDIGSVNSRPTSLPFLETRPQYPFAII